MAKKKTSAKPRKYSFESLIPHETDTENLKNSKLVKEILVEALMEDDLETFEDVLIAHLRAVSKSNLAAKTGLGRQTLYDLLDPKKEFNPTLTTLAAILKSIAA